jgi:hypothetical protein
MRTLCPPWFLAPVVLGASLLTAGTVSAEPSGANQSGLTNAEKAIVAPRLMSDASIVYPEGETTDALVRLKLKISIDGNVTEAIVVDGAPPFAVLAQKAALAWRFAPATEGGERRAAWIVFNVEFTAPKDERVQIVETIPLPKEQTAPSQPSEAVVTVRGVRTPAQVRVMTDEESRIIPGAEGDPLRALDIMPGVVPILGSGPFVGLRGASSGMVGYVYDGIEVPYLFHLGSGPAVVHPWLVESATIYGTGGPARLGRAAGGTIEAVAAKPSGHARASARVRLTDAALGGEIPFAGGRGSVLLGGRYSYTKPLVSMIAPEFTLNYWDYQGRIRYDVTDQGTLELLSFGAGDRTSTIYEDGSKEDLFYGSLHRTALRYENESTDGSWHRLGITLGHDRWDGEPSEIQPFLHSTTVRAESRVPFDDRSWFEYGGDLGLRFQTDYYTPGPSEDVQSYDRTDFVSGGWFDWTFQATQKTTFSTGIRFDVFASGADPFSEQAADFAPQPRLAISHQISDEARLHQSAGLSAQVKSRSQRPPGRMSSVAGGLERSALVDLGLELVLPEGFVFDTTVFHNVYFNVWDVGTIAYVQGQVEDLERGQGQSFGLEASLKRTFARRLRGYLSYTLSHSWRSVGRLITFAEFDRPHVLDLALAYHLGKGWDVTARAKYYRGFPGQGDSVEVVLKAPRTTDYYQVDWQVSKRWEYPESGRWWGVTMGILNTTLNSESNGMFCTQEYCEEELVGPATIPTFGVEGEL